MQKKQEKKVKKGSNFWGIVFFLLLGAACGYTVIAYSASNLAAGLSFGEYLMRLGLLLLCIYAAFFLQMILHEAGHLVFGLLTGYRFSSFRIGSLMWSKEAGKIRFRRMSLVGTGGQCLMSPPDMKDGKIPYVLYNLGGSLMNILAALVFLAAYALWGKLPFLGLLFLLLCVSGFGLALMNGIPLRLGTVDNDGYNARSLGKSPDALFAFWVQMKANEQMAKGARLRDMPEEWFAVPSDEGMKNSMTAVLGVFAANRLLDTHAFDAAKDLMDRLLSMDTAIVGLHRRLLICDRLYCELVGSKDVEVMDRLRSGEQLKFMKQMGKFPAVIRTEYAYALLQEQDTPKARQIRDRFEKRALTYPYAGDLESERELLRIAEECRGV
ncbi:MAG: M50 family metallopeptidase [Clostridiaceae bacterium]|nr:M50 family metallopeptidase [Clostridiaceae bacterium]